MLPSDVSPAALDISFSTLNLGLHCVEDIDEINTEPSSLGCRCQNLLSDLGSHVLEVVPIGIVASALVSSSGSV